MPSVPTEPHDEQAEQAVIGACLTARRLVGAAEVLNGPEFYRPHHETIFAAIMQLAVEGRPTDAVTVSARLQELGEFQRIGEGPYLLACMEACTAVAHAEEYVGIVLDRFARRQEIELGRALVDRALRSEERADQRLYAAESALAHLGKKQDAGDTSSVQPIESFLAKVLPPEEWIMPGLLARGERLILTGQEGLGKTVLTRQLAMCTAAGMSPFSGLEMPHQRVLYVDCENPERIMQKRFGELANAIGNHIRKPQPFGGRMLLEQRPDGIDLLDAADRRWLHRRLKHTRPDLLMIGPIYKITRGVAPGESDETNSRVLAAVMDELRTEFDVGLIMEAHSPKGDGERTRPITPIGSSLWLRWPEFGLGLRGVAQKDKSMAQQRRERLCELVIWKQRDERDWPEMVRSDGPVGMPWVEAAPDEL